MRSCTTNRQAGKIAYGLREGGVPYLDSNSTARCDGGSNRSR
jgi:hypothetical protein